MRFLIVCLLLASGAEAQGWNLRADDQPLTDQELAGSVIGRSLIFFDNGEAKFSVGGAYSYTYFGGGTSFGSFQTQPEGVICITFRNGWSRCDKYIWSADRLVLVTEEGERFPVR